jgi:hypothetical protein
MYVKITYFNKIKIKGKKKKRSRGAVWIKTKKKIDANHSLSPN